MNRFNPRQVTEGRVGMTEFEKELTELITKHSIENKCDIPDFLLASMISSSPLEVARGFTGVDLRAALRAAARVLVRDHSGLVREERFLERGMTVRTRHDTTGDGMFDHLVVYRTGLPASALRDIDADGYYEVAEAYENGRISAVIVDEDDNGVPDVIEYGTGDGIREWDLDQDGTIDVREFGIWTDSVRLQFPFVENAE